MTKSTANDVGTDDASLQLVIAKTASDFDAVHALRNTRYTTRFPAGGGWWLDNDRDQRGIVFLLVEDREPLATMRIIPPSAYEVWELKQLGQTVAPTSLPPNAPLWELGRLAAVSRSPRRGLAAMLFAKASLWSEAHLQIGGFVSYCLRDHVQTWRNIGCQVVGDSFRIEGRTAEYIVISGNLHHVNSHLFGPSERTLNPNLSSAQKSEGKEMSSSKVEKPALRDAVNDVLDGFIEEFYQKTPNAAHFRDSAEVDLEYYKRHTIETVLRIRRKRTVEAHAIHYFTLHDPNAAKEWAEYSADEMLHDKLFAADLERLGVTKDEIYSTEPLLATKLLNGYFLYCSEFEGSPMAMIASSYFLEYTTRRTQPDWLDGLEKSLGREKIKGARAHVNYDIAEDHTADVWNTLVSLVHSDEDETRLLSHFHNVYKLFMMYFHELYEVTRSRDLAVGA